MCAQAMNRQILLMSRPQGMPTEQNFKLVETAIPEPKDGEVLVRSLFISVDPYMRGRMSDRPSYTPPFAVNQPISGDVVGKVVASKHPNFKPEEVVCGILDWADYALLSGDKLRKIDPQLAPISTAIGVLGMPGMTAYFGLLDIGQPKAGETVVISGAAGAVGMIVGEIAKIKGCRVVGIAGSDEKVDYLIKELGFDAAVNYKDPDYAAQLQKACPKGVDIYFDNVGGDITDSVMNLINFHARIVVCGQISMYNLTKPDIGPRLFRTLITKSAVAKGFLVRLDYIDRFPEGVKQMAQWIKQGKIKYRESIVEGLENTPKAFLGLFSGDNIGKQIVKVASLG